MAGTDWTRFQAPVFGGLALRPLYRQYFPSRLDRFLLRPFDISFKFYEDVEFVLAIEVDVSSMYIG